MLAMIWLGKQEPLHVYAQAKSPGVIGEAYRRTLVEMRHREISLGVTVGTQHRVANFSRARYTCRAANPGHE